MNSGNKVEFSFLVLAPLKIIAVVVQNFLQITFGSSTSVTSFPEFCSHEFFSLPRYTREDSVHISLRNTLSVQRAVSPIMGFPREPCALLCLLWAP